MSWPLADRRTECVLDALQRAAAPHLTSSQKRERIAEIWLAAPELGDVFDASDGLRVHLVGVTAAAGITANVHVLWRARGSWSASDVFFHSADELRRTYCHGDRPGYQLRARSSRRTDWADHPLLQRP